jgi:hypothetical protein
MSVLAGDPVMTSTVPSWRRIPAVTKRAVFRLPVGIQVGAAAREEGRDPRRARPKAMAETNRATAGGRTGRRLFPDSTLHSLLPGEGNREPKVLIVWALGHEAATPEEVST